MSTHSETWNTHRLSVEDYVQSLIIRGFTHNGTFLAKDPTELLADMPPHSITVAPLRRSDPEEKLIPRDFLMRVKGGTPTIVKLYQTSSGTQASSLYRSLAYLLVSAHPSLHIVRGLKTMPRGFLAAIPQNELDILSPDGIRVEAVIDRHLEAIE